MCSSEYIQRITQLRSGGLWQSRRSQLSGMWGRVVWCLRGTCRSVRVTWRCMLQVILKKSGILQEYTASYSRIQHSSFNKRVVMSASVLHWSKINQEINFGGSYEDYCMKCRILKHPKLREKWQLMQISWFQLIDLSEICILMVVLYVCTPSSYSKMPPPNFYLLLMLQWLRKYRLLVFTVKFVTDW
jgi:hypothetical protein